MADLNEVERCLQAQLCSESCKDYGPNGPQAEGRARMRRIASRRDGSEPQAKVARQFRLEHMFIDTDNPA